MMRFLYLVAALRTTSDPVKLTDTDSIVFSRMVLTPRAAAICRTRSDFSTRDSTSAWSRISPWWISSWSLMWAILAADPVERLSRMLTWSPRAIRASARWEPIKPAPPVINTRMR